MFRNQVLLPICTRRPKNNKSASGFKCGWAKSVFTVMCCAPTIWQHCETVVGEEFYTGCLIKGTICQHCAWQPMSLYPFDVPKHPWDMCKTLMLISWCFFSKHIICSIPEAPEVCWCKNVLELKLWTCLQSAHLERVCVSRALLPSSTC